MNLEKQIKKIVCSALIILISFILVMNKEVYSSDLDNPIILEPTDNQYLELRAIRANEIDGADYQIILELWAHGIETTGFTFRLGFDSTILSPSSLEDNSYTDDSFEFFRFENGLENNMDSLGIAEDESTLLFMVGLLNDSTEENQYIVEKDGIGKVLDSTTEDVLIGTMSFRSMTKNLADDALSLKTSLTDSPKTGVKVMANKYDYYENQKIFKFTKQLVSTNAKLSSLTTNLKEITNFDRDTFEYTIQIPANNNTITVFPVPEDEKSTVTINGEVVDISTGMETSIRGFSELNNKKYVTVVVTAEDGIATQTYKITIEKQGGFLQGEILTSNRNGIHISKVKVFRADLYIDWKTTSNADLENYEVEVEIETPDDGFFHSVIPTGKYDILIDKVGYLDYVIEDVEIHQQSTTSIGTKQIIPGDVNKDGIVNASDKAILYKTIGAKKGSDRFMIECDYVEDNIINASDKAIFLQNVGKKKVVEKMK